MSISFNQNVLISSQLILLFYKQSFQVEEFEFIFAVPMYGKAWVSFHFYFWGCWTVANRKIMISYIHFFFSFWIVIIDSVWSINQYIYMMHTKVIISTLFPTIFQLLKDFVLLNVKFKFLSHNWLHNLIHIL